MSNENKKQPNDVSSVENAIDKALGAMPVKSLVVIHDVIAGVILGEVDETDHEQELAAGVTYLLIGLGKLPTEYERGISFVPAKDKTK